MYKFFAPLLAAFVLITLPAVPAAAQGNCRFCDTNPPPIGEGGGRPNNGPDAEPEATNANGNNGNANGNSGNGNGNGNNGNGNGNGGSNNGSDNGDTGGNTNGNNGNANGNTGNGNGNGNNGNGNGNGGSNQIELSIESEINFGRLVLIGDGVGRVLIDLQTGAKSVVGNLDDLGGMAVQGRATIRGTAFRTVRIDFPSSISMRDPSGSEAELRDFVTDLSALPMLDSTGTLEFHFTGTLYTDVTTAIGGNLRGRVPISVDYD